MGPSRKTAPSDPSSSKQAMVTPGAPANVKKSKRPQHKKHPSPSASTAASSAALPGVQKIKAALRQTRRLLAKDKLAADVRVATERRLRSLEGDLAAAERARLERTMAARYHKIKFFERQKVVRRLVQAKRKLAAGAADGTAKGIGKKERKELERRVTELRVDLCYILHYPKTKKYISLFPPEVRQAGAGAEASAIAAKEASETDKQREEIRTWMREQMDAGAFSWEPEVELEKSERKAAGAAHLAPTMDTQEKIKGKKGDGAKLAAAKAPKSGVADDDFFGADDGEESDAEASAISEAASGDAGESDEDVDMDE
ncbi:hypothetical protein C2E23DRAFT_575250 [Lenzites betulinus]|nr:hypothetical protein C2E23DRAFT_575250 [Lenzites betulinus]